MSSVTELSEEYVASMTTLNERYRQDASRLLYKQLSQDFHAIQTGIARVKRGDQPINSYVAACEDHRNIRDLFSALDSEVKLPVELCYLVVPLKEGFNGPRVFQFRNRIHEVVGHGKDQDLIARNGQKEEILFDTDSGFANGFLFYSLVARNGASGMSLLKYLEQEFSRTRGQPSGFKEIGLKHVIEPVNFSLLEGFIDYDLSADSARAENYQQPKSRDNRRKRNGGLLLEGNTPEEMRNLALRTIKGSKGNTLTVVQIQEVLGHSSPIRVYEEFKRCGAMGQENGRGQQKLLVPKERVIEFIKTHSISSDKSKWIKSR